SKFLVLDWKKEEAAGRRSRERREDQLIRKNERVCFREGYLKEVVLGQLLVVVGGGWAVAPREMREGMAACC
ncbi:unnamed protein product, partial [Ilex paraguariensis]